MVRRLAPAEGWVTVALLGALVYTTFQTVARAGWGEGVQLAPTLSLVGVLLALVVAKSPLRSLWALPLMLVAGAELVVVAQAAGGPGATWSDRLGWFFGTWWTWIGSVVQHGAAHDQLVFSTIVNWIAFTIGVCSSWLVFRLQNGWWPLIANATLGLVHLSYATVDSIPGYLGSLVFGVLSIAALDLSLRRTAWRGIGVPVQVSSAFWTLVAAAGLAGLAMLIAFHLPSGAINAELAHGYETATAPWKELQRAFDRFVGGGRGQARPGSGLAFSTSLVPREDFDLGSEPILKVASPQRRYWRTVTYDDYDGHSIATSGTTEQRYEAGQDLPTDPDGGASRATIEQRVTILASSASVLFAADAPLRFSVPLVVDQRDVGWDQAALRLAVPLQRGQSYAVLSAVPAAGRRDLDAAPTAYPDWARRYLEVPSSLPPRVAELATRLTAGAASPFDRALLVEEYLRGMSYSTHAVVPPPDRDWVDFLLFDTQVGYCDYFATAMTVLLRTQGIPARVASGFAPGSFDEQEGVWLVRESDAHSWVEAYLPGYGWQLFEPSQLRQRPDRPAGSAGGESVGAGRGLGRSGGPLDEPLDEGDGALTGGGAFAPSSPSLTPLGSVLIWLGGGFLGLGLLGALGAGLWERGLAAEPPARRRYGHLRRLLRLADWSPPDSLTPTETAGQAAARWPELSPEVEHLARLHAEATYGLPGRGNGAEAEAAWRALRPRLLRLVARRRVAGHGPHPADRPE